MTTVRVTEGTQAKLKKAAEELRLELGRPVSMNKVLERLLKARKLSPSDFQGTWEMTDKEAKEFFKSLRKSWANSKFPSG